MTDKDLKQKLEEAIKEVRCEEFGKEPYNYKDVSKICETIAK